MKEKLKLENVTFVPIQHSNVMPEVWASADIGIISLKSISSEQYLQNYMR